MKNEIAGFVLIRNERAFKAWMKKQLLSGFAPPSYPVFVREALDAHEEGYPIFLTVEDISKMSEAVTP